LHTAIDLNEKPSRDSLVETAEAEQTEREIAGSCGDIFSNSFAIAVVDTIFSMNLTRNYFLPSRRAECGLMALESTLKV
jgi:hypothetical protein